MSNPERSIGSFDEKDALKYKNLVLNDKHYEMEQQFVLRLPEDDAALLNEYISEGTLMDKLRIKFVDGNIRKASVILMTKEGVFKNFDGELHDLPCLVEAHKAFDGNNLYKVGDISHILICTEADKEKEKARNFKYPHGLTPPLFNVLNDGFRKPIRNDLDSTNEEYVKVIQEVRELLELDSVCKSMTIEAVYDNDSLKEDAEPAEGASSTSNFFNYANDNDEYSNQTIDEDNTEYTEKSTETQFRFFDKDSSKK